jgi:hypothetical protein
VTLPTGAMCGSGFNGSGFNGSDFNRLSAATGDAKVMGLSPLWTRKR